MPAPVEPEPPMTGDERTQLVGMLRWQRYTLLNICAGLTGEQLVRRAVPPSALSLLGLVRHMAKVERVWIVERFAGRELPPLWGGFHEDFPGVDADRAAADLARTRDVWAQCDEVAAGLDPDATIEHRGETMSFRFLNYHLLHEYARHNGHADLLREQIDGVTGR